MTSFPSIITSKLILYVESISPITNPPSSAEFTIYY